MKKRILCYGDSNTYGYDPTGGRYDEETRWPMRLQALLGDGYTVIEEGFNGRTIVYDDPAEGGFKSGIQYLPPCLMTHSPLDLILIMLGTNDTKQRFGLNGFTIGYCMQLLLQCAKQYGLDARGNSAKILLVAPPEIGENIMDTLMGPIFGENAHRHSLDMADEYERFAKLQHCEFMRAGDFCKPSRLDGVHLTKEGHARLAEGVRDKVLGIL